MVLEETDVDTVLPPALASAVLDARPLTVAVLRPHPGWTIDARLMAVLAEESDRETARLTTRVTERLRAAEVEAEVVVHLVRGLDGRRRAAVLDRALRALARRHDAEPIMRPLQ